MAIEASGILGPKSKNFIFELGHAHTGAGYRRFKLTPLFVAATVMTVMIFLNLILITGRLM